MADCNACKEKHKAAEPVPYIVHESDMARQERTIKRLWIALILVIVLLVGSNCAWLWYESQFEATESTEITQEVDTGEGDAFVSGTGDINYG
jgi:hypothetical protein